MARRNKKRIYSIILCNHGKQLKSICSEETEPKIYKRFNKLLKESKEIVFPMRFNNHKHVMVSTEYELVIIKCKDFNDKSVNKIRDDSGKYVSYESSDDDWIVIDRASYNIEETFWVYGYHPRLQRKTFEWVFNEFIGNNTESFKSVVLYNNKILIECNGKLDMVICKTKDDSIRFYNLIEEWCTKKKMRRVVFMGDLKESVHKRGWLDKIKKLTNWSNQKITRNSTRP